MAEDVTFFVEEIAELLPTSTAKTTKIPLSG